MLGGGECYGKQLAPPPPAPSDEAIQGLGKGAERKVAVIAVSKSHTVNATNAHFRVLTRYLVLRSKSQVLWSCTEHQILGQALNIKLLVRH